MPDYNAATIRAPDGAQTPTQACTLLGRIYSEAAKARDKGETPQTVVQAMQGYRGEIITEDLIKGAVNEVYHDPGFAGYSGAAFEKQMRDTCLAWGPPKFERQK